MLYTNECVILQLHYYSIVVAHVWMFYINSEIMVIVCSQSVALVKICVYAFVWWARTCVGSPWSIIFIKISEYSTMELATALPPLSISSRINNATVFAMLFLDLLWCIIVCFFHHFHSPFSRFQYVYIWNSNYIMMYYLLCRSRLLAYKFLMFFVCGVHL